MTRHLHTFQEKTDNTLWLVTLSMLALVCILPLILTKYFAHKPFRKTPAPTSLLSTPLLWTPASTETPLTFEPPPTEKTLTITVRTGDTLGKIFQRAGLSTQNLQDVISGRPQSGILKHLMPGQTLTLTIDENHELTSLHFPYTLAAELDITYKNNRYEGHIHQHTTLCRHEVLSTVIRGSLYATAKKANIPAPLITQMRNIFHREIDFKKDPHPGDRLSILYQANYIKQHQVSTGDILAVTYVNKGKTHQAIRYTNSKGTTDYYTPKGSSLQKAYDRYPLQFSRIASPFSLSRHHPILHYRRPHYGIDLAAPIGTPIHAIGDGKIEILGRQHGYGNMIKIRHNNLYSTIYGHLSRFQKGLYHGMQVKRGQVIGYVGRSGLATGPHCHFEFHLRQHPINPTTIALPHADPIPKREIGTFKRHTDQLLAELKAQEKKG